MKILRNTLFFIWIYLLSGVFSSAIRTDAHFIQEDADEQFNARSDCTDPQFQCLGGQVREERFSCNFDSRPQVDGGPHVDACKLGNNETWWRGTPWFKYQFSIDQYIPSLSIPFESEPAFAISRCQAKAAQTPPYYFKTIAPLRSRQFNRCIVGPPPVCQCVFVTCTFWVSFGTVPLVSALDESALYYLTLHAAYPLQPNGSTTGATVLPQRLIWGNQPGDYATIVPKTWTKIIVTFMENQAFNMVFLAHHANNGNNICSDPEQTISIDAIETTIASPVQCTTTATTTTTATSTTTTELYDSANSTDDCEYNYQDSSITTTSTESPVSIQIPHNYLLNIGGSQVTPTCLGGFLSLSYSAILKGKLVSLRVGPVGGDSDCSLLNITLPYSIPPSPITTTSNRSCGRQERHSDRLIEFIWDVEVIEQLQSGVVYREYRFPITIVCEASYETPALEVVDPQQQVTQIGVTETFLATVPFTLTKTSEANALWWTFELQPLRPLDLGKLSYTIDECYAKPDGADSPVFPVISSGCVNEPSTTVVTSGFVNTIRIFGFRFTDAPSDQVMLHCSVLVCTRPVDSSTPCSGAIPFGSSNLACWARNNIGLRNIVPLETKLGSASLKFN